MIKMRELLLESVGGLNPSDIYNFYYLWGLYVNSPNLFHTEFGEYILEEFTKKLKKKYVTLFKQLIAEQLVKYAARKRTDPDFDASKISADAPAKVLWDLMQKTFRSDMQRRNDVWNLVAEYTAKLESATHPKDIFIAIDRLNASVHNTNTSVLGKFTDGSALMRAYNTTDTHDPKYWKQYVDKDIRQLDSQQDLQEGNTVKISRADRENVEFMSGVKLAVQDKAQDVKRDLDGYSSDFIRGYKLVPRDSWWTKANDKITRWAAELGNSYGKR